MYSYLADDMVDYPKAYYKFYYFAASQSSSSRKSQQSSSSKHDSGGDDSFWNAWLPDSEKKTTSSIVKTSMTKLSSSSSVEQVSLSEERKSVSKLESKIESRRRASEKLGLRKTRKKSSNDGELDAKSQETAPISVQNEKDNVVKTTTEVKSEVDSISSTSEVSAVEVKTVTESSPEDQATTQVKLKSHSENNIANDDAIYHTSSVQEVKDLEDDQPPKETHAMHSKDELGTKVEQQEVYMKEEVLPDNLTETAEPIVQSVISPENVDSSDFSQKDTEDKESSQEKLVISLDDSANLTDEGQSWAQRLTEVDLSIVEQQETVENVTVEDKEHHVKPETEDTSACLDVPTDMPTDNGIKTDNKKEEEEQETVIEPKTTEEEETQVENKKEEVQEKVCEETIGAVEPTVDSLSDSKSESSVVEKVQMHLSSESGTTTSEEVDEYNKTLTEEDFKKMVETCEVENKTEVVESDKELPKSSPEHTGTGTSSLTSSGYVKNMLEEAMVESLKESDSHSDRSSDKSSDMVRIESGMNSGHTSGDEIDTTTSSDIEIISTPTPNGEYKIMERPFDLSPLRHALSKTVRRGGSPPGHKRSDSGSSAHSNWSKNGDDLLSPDGMMHKHHDIDSSHLQG